MRLLHLAGALALLTAGPALAGPAFVTADLPPFAIHDEQQPGFTVELTRAAAARAGIPFSPTFLPWARAQETAQTDPDTFILGLTRTPDREPKYQWVADLLTAKVAFVSVKPKPPIDSVEQAKSLADITVRAKTPFEELLRTAGIAAVTAVQTEEANAKKIKDGHTDAWLTYDLRARFVWQRVGGDPALLVIGRPLTEEHIYLAANPKADPVVAAHLAKAVGELRAGGDYDRLFAKYFGG